MNARPLFIIGAGRSGTNILRDTMVRLPGFATWDCDEINLIWRHGNTSRKDDLFGKAEARPEVVAYIKSQFGSLQRKTGARVIVEKTCANTLRIPFIETIFPDARYLHIVRDGRDVTLSSMFRWTATVEPAYLFKKLRYVPLSDVPVYGARFIANRIHQMRNKDRRQAIWGPVFPGMRDIAHDKPLVEVCAMQWAACVMHSSKAFSHMPESKVKSIRYEDLVKDPNRVINSVCNWYEPELSTHLPAGALTAIHAGSTNGWAKRRNHFTDHALDILQPMLNAYGYETAA